MTDTLRFALIMLAAGVGIPVLAALNAQLGGRIGSPAAAAAVLFCVALGVAVAVAILTGGTGALGALPQQPAHLFLGGVLIAFYVLSITWVAPRFGIGNAIVCVLLGQMAAATAIDHWGLFGAAVRPLTALRGAGVGLMALGVLLVQKG